MPEKCAETNTGELIADLQQTVEELSQEVHVLRTVLDEIRDDYRWALRNGHPSKIEETVRGAESTRLQRANQKTATVEQFDGDLEGLQITIKEGYHTRQEIPLWICQLSERIDRATFTDLKIKAKQLGGWWSSFKKADAGFQFKSEESAQKFQSLPCFKAMQIAVMNWQIAKHARLKQPASDSCN